VDSNAGLLIDTVKKLSLGFVIKWAWFARPPLDNLEVILEAATPREFTS